MNRNHEMDELLAGMNETPAALDYTLTRARVRLRKQKKHAILAPLGGLCTLMLTFVLLVNFSTPFASACSGIPLISQLAAAVNFSPSLSAAIDNDYIQPVEQEQTQNGVTCRVLGVIVDRKQLNIFFTLTSKTHTDMGADIELHAADGGELSSVSYGGEWKGGDNGIYQTRADFYDLDMPDSLYFTVSAVDAGNTVASFTFPLKFDPYFTSQGETIPVNTSFDIDGNDFTITDVELYPTQMRLNLSSDPENRAWLRGLDFILTDGAGNSFTRINSGIISYADNVTGECVTLCLDSPYFFSSEQLTLHITGAQWLDKEQARCHVDLVNQTAEHLPPNTELLYARSSGHGWEVAFIVDGGERAPEDGYHSKNVFSGIYYDAQGEQHSVLGASGTVGREDPETGERTDEWRYFTETLFLDDYDGTEVWFRPLETGSIELAHPVDLVLR